MQFYEEELERAFERYWDRRDRGIYLLRREGGRSRGPRGYWVLADYVNPELAGTLAVAFIEPEVQ